MRTNDLLTFEERLNIFCKKVEEGVQRAINKGNKTHNPVPQINQHVPECNHCQAILNKYDPNERGYYWHLMSLIGNCMAKHGHTFSE